MDGNRNGIWNRMVDMDEFHIHTAKADMFARLYNDFPYFAVEPMLLQLIVYKGQCKLCPINRKITFFKQIRKRANMVFMPMR